MSGKNASGGSGGREILSLHFGQAGIQMGSAIWEQYCKEHKIRMNGNMISQSKSRRMEKIRKNKDGEWERVMDDDEKSFAHKKSDLDDAAVFFQHVEQTDKFVPRTIIADLEANVIDDLKTSEFGTLFNPNTLIAGKEDAANNYARGRYTVGKELAPQVFEAIRKEVENCDHLQSFIFNFATGGGTGSGLGGLVAETLSEVYRKKAKISYAVYPSPQLSTAVVEPYNALLSTHDLIDHNNITVIVDNEACYELCQTHLNFKKPSYWNINNLVSKAISSITSGLRFTGQQMFTVADLQTNLVPFPRLHFMTAGVSPLIAEDASDYDACDTVSITNRAFQPNHMLVKYNDWDVEEDQYMGISITFRGNANPKGVNEAVQELKTNKVRLVEWCPTGFKVSMIDKPCAVLSDDGMAATERSVVMIGNNTAVGRPLQSRIARKYDLLYSQRAFVHWYVGEGMEEGEFAEAREDLEMLLRDFEDMKVEPNTDDATLKDDDDDGEV